MISRTSVDTIQSENTLSIGLKVERIHEGNKVSLAFTSLEKALLELDTSSAMLVVDGSPLPLVFDKAGPFEALPLLQEIWFAKLDPGTVEKIAHSKTMSIQISNKSGAMLKNALSPAAIKTGQRGAIRQQSEMSR